MLDLSRIYPQITEFVRLAEQRAEEQARALDQAASTLRSSDWRELGEKARRSRTSWLVARLLEPPAQAHPLPPLDPIHTALATDGSQIAPSRHQIAPCYLLNLGRVVLHYGTGEPARLESRPQLYFRPEEVMVEYGGRQVPVEGKVLAIKRLLAEMGALAGLVEEHGGSELLPNGRTDPAVAFTDGSLILWQLESEPDEYRAGMLKEFLAALEPARRQRIPVVGYISRPGSRDVVNALRIGDCPLESPDCDRCPYRAATGDRRPEVESGGAANRQSPIANRESTTDNTSVAEGSASEQLPCARFAELSDGGLFARLLQPGERSALFGSESKILESYGEHQTRFCYLNVGPEIARLELPAWAAQDGDLLALAHAAAHDQAQKGGGYPVSLAESHAQAVVRGADRDAFYRLLERAMVEGKVRAEHSRKEMGKLWGRV